MHSVIRLYTGMPGVGPRFVAKREAIEKTLKAVPGFMSYRLIGTANGIASITTCENAQGCDASVQVAAAWVKENFPDLAGKAPQVVSGESLMDFGAPRKPKV